MFVILNLIQNLAGDHASTVRSPREGRDDSGLPLFRLEMTTVTKYTPPESTARRHSFSKL